MLKKRINSFFLKYALLNLDFQQISLYTKSVFIIKRSDFMTIIFFWLSVVLIISIGLLHVFWACGGNLWGDYVLPEYKYNYKPQFFKKTPGPFMCLLVASAFFVLALLEIIYHYKIGNPPFISLLLKLACIVFIGRIVGEFNCLGLFKRERDTQFARMDNLIYIPICVYLLISLIIQLVVLK